MLKHRDVTDHLAAPVQHDPRAHSFLSLLHGVRVRPIEEFDKEGQVLAVEEPLDAVCVLERVDAPHDQGGLAFFNWGADGGTAFAHRREFLQSQPAEVLRPKPIAEVSFRSLEDVDGSKRVTTQVKEVVAPVHGLHLEPLSPQSSQDLLGARDWFLPCSSRPLRATARWGDLQLREGGEMRLRLTHDPNDDIVEGRRQLGYGFPSEPSGPVLEIAFDTS